LGKMEETRREPDPVPIVDPSLCDGCSLCVQVCPTGALAIEDGRAVVARPEACQYSGLCEMTCPWRAIQRPFEVVVVSS